MKPSAATRERSAFTLVELLVVVAVVAVLIGVLLPALAGARRAGHAAVCLSNLRQAFTTCAYYAHDHNGHGPAIGVPYASLPNWAMVVQTEARGGAGRAGTSPGEVFHEASVLVCPACQAQTGERMTRTYAMNATGLSGLPGDGGDYDQRPTFIRFDLVRVPSATPLLLDAAPLPQGPELPPPTRTASVIDLRQEAHATQRIGRWHGGRADARFHAVRFDGSAGGYEEVPASWLEALP